MGAAHFGIRIVLSFSIFSSAIIMTDLDYFDKISIHIIKCVVLVKSKSITN